MSTSVHMIEKMNISAAETLKPLRYVLRDSYTAKRLWFRETSGPSFDWTSDHTTFCYGYAVECLKAVILDFYPPPVDSSVVDFELVSVALDAYFGLSACIPNLVPTWMHNDACDDRFCEVVRFRLLQACASVSPVTLQLVQHDLFRKPVARLLRGINNKGGITWMG